MEQKVLITGGTSGIGLATAELLHERGARVMVTGRSVESVERALRELPAEIEVLQADSASPSDATWLADRVAERFGTLTGVFLNAGITHPRPIERVDPTLFEDLLATNATGAFFTLQAVVPLLDNPSSVLFTVGIGATRGIAGQSATVASRGALLAMVPSLAVELAPRGIRVNAVSPGAIDTPIWSRSGLSAERLAEVKAGAAAEIPLGRLGTAREVAAAAAFLLSDDASYVTGQELVVSGGSGLRP